MNECLFFDGGEGRGTQGEGHSAKPQELLNKKRRMEKLPLFDFVALGPAG